MSSDCENESALKIKNDGYITASPGRQRGVGREAVLGSVHTDQLGGRFGSPRSNREGEHSISILPDQFRGGPDGIPGEPP